MPYQAKTYTPPVRTKDTESEADGSIQTNVKFRKINFSNDI